ncbi:uncharacterized protein [Osmerus mordax]|uniref:uncharacterized protein n=1 Tax=Osmerus mordax TaxID=8014 RepID=UPI0035108AEF
MTSGPLLPWEFSPLYCGPVVIWTGRSLCSALVSSERNHASSFSWTRGSGSKKVHVQMCRVCMVRGADARLWWAMSEERSRLGPNGFPHMAAMVMAVTGVQLIGGQVRQYQSHVCSKTDFYSPVLADEGQTDVSIMEVSMVVGPDGILRTTARTSWGSRNTCEEESFSQDQDSFEEEDEGWTKDQGQDWDPSEEDEDDQRTLAALGVQPPLLWPCGHLDWEELVFCSGELREEPCLLLLMDQRIWI